MQTKELTIEELEAMLAEKRKAEKEQNEQARKDYEAEKDLYIDATIAAFCEIHTEMVALKENTLSRSQELYNKMYELNGKEPKKVNSFTIQNEAKTAKVVVEIQERFSFTEEAMVHINTIKDIFKEKFAGVSEGMYSILDHLMMKNSKGDYDPKLLTKIRKQVTDLADPELSKAYEALVACQTVDGSGTYARAYKKDAKGKWQDITLQFSAL